MATAKVKKMKRHYLPFEKPLKDLDFEIEKLTTSESDSKQLKDLIAEREKFGKRNFYRFISLGDCPTSQTS